MITLTTRGNFKNIEKFLNSMKSEKYFKILDTYGKQGVLALSNATPVDSGKTASSWDYEVKSYNGGCAIYWTNSNINKNVNIAIILQYGHGTRNGGYVVGRDYINPAIRPIFDKMADAVWREVVSA